MCHCTAKHGIHWQWQLYVVCSEYVWIRVWMRKRKRVRRLSQVFHNFVGNVHFCKIELIDWIAKWHWPFNIHLAVHICVCVAYGKYIQLNNFLCLNYVLFSVFGKPAEWPFIELFHRMFSILYPIGVRAQTAITNNSSRGVTFYYLQFVDDDKWKTITLQ